MSFYDTANVFVCEPQRCYAVALFFILLPLVGAAIIRSRRALLHWPAPAAAVAWFLFGLNEYFCRRDHSNIRIDLLLTWPLLVLGTVACLAIWVRMVVRNINPVATASSKR